MILSDQSLTDPIPREELRRIERRFVRSTEHIAFLYPLDIGDEPTQNFRLLEETATSPIKSGWLTKRKVFSSACAAALFAPCAQAERSITEPVAIPQTVISACAQASTNTDCVANEAAQLAKLAAFSKKLSESSLPPPQYSVDVINEHFWDLL